MKALFLYNKFRIKKTTTTSTGVLKYMFVKPDSDPHQEFQGLSTVACPSPPSLSLSLLSSLPLELPMSLADTGKQVGTEKRMSPSRSSYNGHHQ